MDADSRLTPEADAAGAVSTAPLDAPRLRMSARAAALLQVIACSGFPTQLVIAMLLGPGIRPTASGALTLWGVTALLTLDSLAVLGLVWWFLRHSGERPAVVFLGTRHPAVETLVGVSLTPLVFGLVLSVALLLARIAPTLRPPENPFAALLGSPLDVAVLAVVAVVAGGVREEIQRAFILRRFEQYLGGGTVGLVCFSLVFGLGHVVQGWPAVITTTLLGVLWGLVYLRRRSIVGPMVSHSAFNLFQVLFFRLHG
jgi:membrane protease YdiL (CAAX protease family)